MRQGISEKFSKLKLKDSRDAPNGAKIGSLESTGVSVETIAATRIQTAFRAYKVC